MTELAFLVSRTAHFRLLEYRKAKHSLCFLRPHAPVSSCSSNTAWVPTVLDLLISVRGMIGWVFAQQELRDKYPCLKCESVEVVMWELEVKRCERMLIDGPVMKEGGKKQGVLTAKQLKQRRQHALRMVERQRQNLK